jgi:sugar phosphate isomerase/epimerase
MQFSIASYSFHRLLQAGKQDIFKYITDCKELGCTQLDPWNGHLAALIEETEQIRASATPLQAHFSSAGLDYARKVRAAADAAGLPFGNLAIDGAHMWEPTLEERQKNRASAYRWLEVAQILGASSVRMDSGGTPDLPDAMFQIVVEGFKDVVAHAGERGIRVVIENHWGASHVPKNVVRILDAVPGLGLLFDSNNWADGTQEEGWQLCVPRANEVHIKTFNFDANGNDPGVDIPRVISMLVKAGYNGCWGIESTPEDGDEYGAARKTMALIERSVKAV